MTISVMLYIIQHILVAIPLDLKLFLFTLLYVQTASLLTDTQRHWFYDERDAP